MSESVPPEQADPDHRYIPGFPGYCVSRDGKPYSCRGRWGHWHPLRVQMQKNRLFVTLWADEAGRSVEKKSLSLPRLVALAWIGPPPAENSQVYHKDKNLSNCHADNIAWGSPTEVTNHYRTIRATRAKLSKQDVIDLRRAVFQDGPDADLDAYARKYGCTRANILAIVIRKTYKWVDAGVPAYRPKPRPKFDGGIPLFTDAEAHRIKQRLLNGETAADIHRDIGKGHYLTVLNILTNPAYAHVKV